MAMTTLEKRQVLYAALLRFSPEAGFLRERVLDRIVLVALLDSSSSQPMRVGKIRAQTRIGKQGQGLRTEVIQETLARLTRHDTVAQTQLNKRHAYHLTDSGRKDPDEEAAESASQLFEPVLARMLKDTHLMCDKHDGATVCRTFISECFARFGQQIARAVTGGLSNDQLVNRADVEGAFQAAANLVQLSLDAKQSLKARCVRFLKSTERDDEELKFRLTQGYFVTQLLSLDVYSLDFRGLGAK